MEDDAAALEELRVFSKSTYAVKRTASADNQISVSNLVCLARAFSSNTCTDKMARGTIPTWRTNACAHAQHPNVG
jgi:hypothetical protein